MEALIELSESEAPESSSFQQLSSAESLQLHIAVKNTIAHLSKSGIPRQEISHLLGLADDQGASLIHYLSALDQA